MPSCDNGANTVYEDDRIQVYFSPYDNCDEKVIGTIAKAKKHWISQYTLLTDHLLPMRSFPPKNRGVAVRVIFDDGQLSGPTSKHEELKSAGIPVKKLKPSDAACSVFHYAQ